MNIFKAIIDAAAFVFTPARSGRAARVSIAREAPAPRAIRFKPSRRRAHPTPAKHNPPGSPGAPYFGRFTQYEDTH